MVPTGSARWLRSVEVHGGRSVWPLHVFPSGCRVKPTGQLQRTPVDVSLQVQSHPPLFTAHVSETTGHCVNARHWLSFPLCGKELIRHWHAVQSLTCGLHQKHTTKHIKDILLQMPCHLLATRTVDVTEKISEHTCFWGLSLHSLACLKVDMKVALHVSHEEHLRCTLVINGLTWVENCQTQVKSMSTTLLSLSTGLV